MLPRVFYRLRLKYILAIAFGLYVLSYLGAFTHPFEIAFDADTFEWPQYGDVQRLAQLKRHGQPLDPHSQPINQYNHTFLKPCAQKCRTEDGSLIAARLVFLVKSALPNFGRRQAIRKSWGFERRLSDVVIRTVFLLGTAGPTTPEPVGMQHMIDVESEQFEDIVQADFHDAYFNNTLKTMTGFRWAIANCPRSQFYMFVDDDYYVSAKNVLRFVRNPVNYPEYLEEADETLRKLARRLSQSDQAANGSALVEAEHLLAANDVASSNTNRKYVQEIRQFVDAGKSKQRRVAEEEKLKLKKEELLLAQKADGLLAGDVVASQRRLMEVELAKNVRLFTGFVFSSSPHRHRSSKWYVSLDEYPWDRWPPYVTAGSFILSREALMQMFYVSMFTKHFR